MITYRAFPAKLRIQAVGFATPDFWTFKDNAKFNQVLNCAPSLGLMRLTGESLL